MDLEKQAVWLPYQPIEMTRLIDYVESHDLESGGRYQTWMVYDEDVAPIRELFALKVLTHSWTCSATKAEATNMCGYWIDLSGSAIASVIAAPNFDLDTAYSELGVIEEAALGFHVHGRGTNL